MRRACVFVDGSNFYHRVLKNLGIQESNFDFNAFAQFLVSSYAPSENQFRHYSGVIAGVSFHEMSDSAKDHQKTIRSLMSLDCWSVITAKLRTRKEHIVIDDRVDNHVRLKELGVAKICFSREREKTIDMKIGLDMMLGALDNLYDVAILISSDSDLVPVCELVKSRFWKRVEYVGFHIIAPDTTVPTKALMYATDSQRIFGPDDIKRFVRR